MIFEESCDVTVQENNKNCASQTNINFDALAFFDTLYYYYFTLLSTSKNIYKNITHKNVHEEH